MTLHSIKYTILLKYKFIAAIYGKSISHIPLLYFSHSVLGYISIYSICRVYFYWVMQLWEIFFPVEWYKYCVPLPLEFFRLLFFPSTLQLPLPILLSFTSADFSLVLFFSFTLPIIHTQCFYAVLIRMFRPTFYILQYRACQ